MFKTLKTGIVGTMAAALISTAVFAGEAKVVTYLEVEAGAVENTTTLLADYIEAAKAGQGNEGITLLQRIGRPSHFVILEDWTDSAAQKANVEAEATQAIRAKLAPMLTSAYDERPHLNLATGEAKDLTDTSIVAVTHVDIVPTFKEAGIALVKQLAADSRGTAGNLRFDALTQESRTNHMTLVEAWDSSESQLNHASQPYARSMRKGLTPISGSLFDERLFKAIK